MPVNQMFLRWILLVFEIKKSALRWRSPEGWIRQPSAHVPTESMDVKQVEHVFEFSTQSERLLI